MDLRYDSIAALIEAAKQSGRKLSELVLEQQAVQMEQSADELYEIMRKSYAVMAASVEEGKAPGVRSASGLSGGDAYRMARAEREGNVLCGGVFSGALTRALAVSEWNAAMGRIVAAPTAGSCGILPAAVLTLQAERKLPERACVHGVSGWYGDCKQCVHCGRAGRLSGRVRQCRSHGCGGSCGIVRRHAGYAG